MKCVTTCCTLYKEIPPGTTEQPIADSNCRTILLKWLFFDFPHVQPSIKMTQNLKASGCFTSAVKTISD